MKLIPELRAKFPQSTFETKDPNEEWEVPENLMVIDTVIGLDQVQVFHGLETFTRAPRVTMHDFDALTQLRLLQKLGKLKVVTIIGVPPMMKVGEALNAIAEVLEKIQHTPGIVEASPK